MSNMVIKTTLLRSNPRIIRQFVIDGNRTVEELTRMIAVAHGWKNSVALKLYTKNGVVSGKIQIKDIVDDAKELVLGMPMEGGAGRQAVDILTGECTDWWRFFVELISKEEDVPALQESTNADKKDSLPTDDASLLKNDQPGRHRTKMKGEKAVSKIDEPKLVRSYGLHPAEKCRSMSDCNTVHRYMNQEGGYLPYYIGKLNAANHKVNMTKINKLLKQKNLLPAQKDQPIRICHEYGKNLRTILEKQQVGDLKQMIRITGVPVSVNQVKQNLISGLVEYFTQPMFWQYLIDSMNLEEYQLFKRIVTGESRMNDHYAVEIMSIARFGMFGEYYRKIDWIPKEFLEYYEELLQGAGDEGLMKEKKADEILMFCGLLYGVFSKEVYEKVCMSLYPEEDDIAGYWEALYLENANEYSNIWKRLKADVICDVDQIGEKDARQMMQSDRFKDGIFFIPTREEYQAIRKNGLNYSDDGIRKLCERLRFLSKGLRFEAEYEIVCRFIYDYCRKELNGDLKTYIAGRLGRSVISSAREIDRLKETMESLSGEVRLIRLGGYTEKEFAELKKKG